jgi:hypothetical protein
MRSIGGSAGVVLMVIVWTAELPGAIFPIYSDPPTLMAAAGWGHSIKKTIHPIVMMDRTREPEKGFT